MSKKNDAGRMVSKKRSVCGSTKEREVNGRIAGEKKRDFREIETYCWKPNRLTKFERNLSAWLER